MGRHERAGTFNTPRDHKKFMAPLFAQNDSESAEVESNKGPSS